MTVDRRVSYRRVRATSPGKHGPLDWRVALGGEAPTHGEILALLGMIFIAEDRYPLHGRAMLWDYLDRVYLARSPEAVLALAAECDGTTKTTVEAAAGLPPSPRPPSASSYPTPYPGGSQ